MASDRIYPATQKKISELRGKGIIPYSKLAWKFITLGCIIILGNFIFPSFKQLFSGIKDINDTSSLEVLVSTINANTVFLLIKGSAIILVLSFFLPWINAKFLLLPFKKYPDGIKYSRQSISILSELFWSLICSPLSLLIILMITNYDNRYHSLNPKNLVNFSINSLGIYFTFIGLFLSLIESLGFRLSHKMNKEEIITESLEGQMSGTNRSLISKAGSEL